MTDYTPCELRPSTPGFSDYEPRTGEPQLVNELRVHVFDRGLLSIWARHTARPNCNRTDSAIVEASPQHAAEFAARPLGVDNDQAALAAGAMRLQAEIDAATAAVDQLNQDASDDDAARDEGMTEAVNATDSWSGRHPDVARLGALVDTRREIAATLRWVLNGGAGR